MRQSRADAFTYAVMRASRDTLDFLSSNRFVLGIETPYLDAGSKIYSASTLPHVVTMLLFENPTNKTKFVAVAKLVARGQTHHAAKQLDYNWNFYSWQAFNFPPTIIRF